MKKWYSLERDELLHILKCKLVNCTYCRLRLELIDKGDENG
jgi:hypothetical protein